MINNMDEELEERPNENDRLDLEPEDREHENYIKQKAAALTDFNKYLNKRYEAEFMFVRYGGHPTYKPAIDYHSLLCIMKTAAGTCVGGCSMYDPRNLSFGDWAYIFIEDGEGAYAELLRRCNEAGYCDDWEAE